MPPAILNKRKPYIMAHRGASDHAPENTLGSFRLALEAGADILETDLWFTADGQLVCHHDDTAARMTGDRRTIASMTLAEVRALRVRSPFDDRFPDEQIPTLEELLALTPPDIVLAVELKDPRFREVSYAQRLAAQVAERIQQQTILAISFEMPWLKAVKAASADFPTGHITLRNPFPVQPTDVLGPFWPLLVMNPLYVKMAHRQGKWVCPLDPGLHQRLPRYLRMGVDAVLTNDPAATRALVERLRPQ